MRPRDADPRDAGKRLLKQLKVLQLKFVGEDREACQVATRPRQIANQPRLNRVATDADDRDRAGKTRGCHERGRRPGDKYVDLMTEEVGKQRRNVLRRGRDSVIDDAGLPLDIPVVAQTLPDRLGVVDR